MTSRLWGADANVRQKLMNGCNYRLDLLGGFRYLELREDLHIHENLMVLGASPVTGIQLADRFGTRNQFYGGQVGLDGEYRWRRWFVEGRGTFALGSVNQEVGVNGTTVFNLANGIFPPVVMGPGGLLAQMSNSGHFSRSRIAFVPEVGIKVGYQVTNNLRAYLGYDLLYLNNAVRPGDQIDRTVNIAQRPGVLIMGNTAVAVPGGLNGGPARPMPLFKETDFWAHGVNFGLEFRF
jgi:hypothetical protein